MTTDFTSLPLIDLSPLSASELSPSALTDVAEQLDNTFRTVGFAYLTNPPLSLDHQNVFSLAESFFSQDASSKHALAKKTFNPANKNSYRGYFPAQPQSAAAASNLKEGFEVGPAETPKSSAVPVHGGRVFDLSEGNVWPESSSESFGDKHRQSMQTLHTELQSLSQLLLQLLASQLSEHSSTSTSFDPQSMLQDSVSTLRLLHYPPSPATLDSTPEAGSEPRLACTPHTDSGLLTLLHQDSTGGLEVRNSSNQWIPAPYVPGSVVVNIGDLMARLSGGRYVATFHRVRAVEAISKSQGAVARRAEGMGRFSVPFFCEPGVDCLVPNGEIDEYGNEEKVRYEEFVLGKMSTWVEFQDLPGVDGSAVREEKGVTWERDVVGGAVETIGLGIRPSDVLGHSLLDALSDYSERA